MPKKLTLIERANKAALSIIRSHEEPFDGDQTEELAKVFLAYLDSYSGNITDDELRERLDNASI